jgi:hypothetical protein
MPHNHTPHETLLLLQTSADFQIKLEVHLQDGAYWMSQNRSE